LGVLQAMSKWVQVHAFLVEVNRSLAPTQRATFLTQGYIGNEAIIQVFRTLDWLMFLVPKLRLKRPNFEKVKSRKR